MEIRKAKKTDLKDLVEIVKGAEILWDYFGKQSHKMILKLINNKDFVFLVAEENKKILGFLDFEIEKEAGRIYLNTIAVRKDSRGRGVGAMLFKKMEEYVIKLKLKKVFFIVRDYNREMNSFAKGKKFKLVTKLNYWEKDY